MQDKRDVMKHLRGLALSEEKAVREEKIIGIHNGDAASHFRDRTETQLIIIQR